MKNNAYTVAALARSLAAARALIGANNMARRAAEKTGSDLLVDARRLDARRIWQSHNAIRQQYRAALAVAVQS